MTRLRRLLRPSKSIRTGILQTLGFALLSAAFFMWIPAVGVGVAGVSLIVLAGLLE